MPPHIDLLPNEQAQAAMRELGLHEGPAIAPSAGVDIDRTLAERKEQYGEAWLVTGQVVNFLDSTASLDRIIVSGLFYNWITILCKLIRLMASPNHYDSWRDIAGYAQLVMDKLAAKETK